MRAGSAMLPGRWHNKSEEIILGSLMAIPWFKIASTIGKLGRIALTTKKITDQIKEIEEIKERSNRLDPAVREQMQQFEKALAMQSQLNDKYNAQLDLMKATFEHIQKSIWRLSLLLVLALVMSTLAVVLVALQFAR